MGNIHTPKTIYGNGLVMEFYVKNKQVFYKLSKWVDLGSNLSLIESAKLENQKPEDIMNKAQQSFTGVMQK
jgi:hypothetical protein